MYKHSIMKDHTSFENLEVWAKSKELTIQIYRITKEGYFKNDFEMINQIRRASLSIMNNIAEGYHRYSRKESIRFLNIAYSSCQETKCMVILASELGYLLHEQKNLLDPLIESTLKLIGGYQRYLIRNTKS